MQSGKTFIRNTLWYFIPFLIMTVLAIISLNYTFHMMQAQNYEIVHTQLQRSMEDMEEQLYMSRQIALEISIDSNLTKEKMSDQGIMTIKGMDRLGEYRWRMELLSALFLSYVPEKVISENGTCSMKSFCEGILDVTEESWQKVAVMMQERSSSSCVLEKIDGSQVLFLLYYYPQATYVSERWVGFLIDTSKIEKQIQGVLGDMDSRLILTYEDQQIVEMNQLSDAIAAESIPEVFNGEKNSYNSSSEYAVMEIQGKTLDMYMQAMLNKSVFMQMLKKEQLKLFSISITAFLMLSLFLWFYGRYQYKKARDVQLLAVNMYPELAHKEIRGEYEFIRKVLEKDFERLKHHDWMLNYFRKESKKQLTWLLLKSTLPEEIQIEELMENCGMEVTGSYYAVLEFLLPKEEYKADFLDDMPQVLMYHLEKCDAGMLLIVVASLESRDETHVERFVLSEQILQELSCVGYICKGVTCGLVYESLSEIHSSQEEAFSLVTLLDKDESKTKNKIVFFDEAAQMSKRVPHITSDLLQQFKECLMQEKGKEAIALLDALLAPPKEMAQELLTYSRYKIIQIMANEWKAKGTSAEKMDSFLILMNLEGDAFKEEVKKCITLFCTQEEPHAVEVDIEQILSFISEHAWDSQLSMNLITDSLGISERTVRRIMKEKINKTYKEYITEIRLGKACELLEHTNLDVQTIVTQVGYYNVPSFNRLFKLAYGVSPGEYRVKNRGNMQ